MSCQNLVKRKANPCWEIFQEAIRLMARLEVSSRTSNSKMWLRTKSQASPIACTVCGRHISPNYGPIELFEEYDLECCIQCGKKLEV